MNTFIAHTGGQGGLRAGAEEGGGGRTEGGGDSKLKMLLLSRLRDAASRS